MVGLASARQDACDRWRLARSYSTHATSDCLPVLLTKGYDDEELRFPSRLDSARIILSPGRRPTRGAGGHSKLSRVAPRIRVAELDRLIQVIHRDLKELRKDHPWFAKYDDKCLLDTDSERYGDSIYYATLKPKSSPMSMQPQQPDHISIGYCPAGDSGKNVRKYYNDLEDVPACQFPLWALKVGAQFKVPDEETEKAIRRCIIARCEELQKELARRLPQPHYQRQASDPAWLATVVQFHGHLGPAVVAGARMGTAGLRAVEAQGFFDVEVTCEGPLAKPPQSCFLDGVQVATGATMGKGGPFNGFRPTGSPCGSRTPEPARRPYFIRLPRSWNCLPHSSPMWGLIATIETTRRWRRLPERSRRCPNGNSPR